MSLNSLLDKAISVANVAGKKTEEMVEASKLKFHRLCLCYLQALCLYAFEHFLIYRCGGRHISLNFRHNEFIHLKLVYYLAHFTNMVSVRVGGNEIF